MQKLMLVISDYLLAITNCEIKHASIVSLNSFHSSIIRNFNRSELQADRCRIRMAHQKYKE